MKRAIGIARRPQRRAEAFPAGGGGAYVGASGRRSMLTWAAQFATADADILPALRTLRDRSRDLDRNSPAARGALKTMLTGVIGSGLRMQPAIDRDFLGMSEEQAQEWQNIAEQEFRLWAESRQCDFMRQLTFTGLQRLTYHSKKTAGDVFVLMPWVQRPGVPYDLRLQLIEADRVCNPNDFQDTDEIAGGIERNRDGVPVAIHIRTPHPGSGVAVILQQMAPTWKRVPIYGGQTARRNVLHLMDVDRIGQSRGVPVLAPVIETLKQISKYSEAELAAAVVNALLSVFIKRPLEDTAGGGVDWNAAYEARGETPPWEDPARFTLGSGTWLEGAPGEDLQIVNAARPSNQFDPFFLANMKQIGMALGIPFEVLIKHFSSSYSASRAAMLDFYRTCEVERDDFADAFCQPSYEEFLIEAVIKGRIHAPGFLTDPAIRLAFSGAYFVGPAQGQIDEIKEVEAANKRVEYGFSTRAMEAQKLTGHDYDDIVRARAEEVKLEERYGWSPAQSSGSGFNSGNDAGGGDNGEQSPVQQGA